MLRLLCTLGLVLAGYALYVEDQSARAELEGLTYTALCDVNKWISCSKVFNSQYGHIFFGLPNALVGSFYYLAVLLSTFSIFKCIPYLDALVTGAVLFAAGFSVVLASILFSMGDFCIICVSTYAVNFAMVYALFSQPSKDHKKNE